MSNCCLPYPGDFTSLRRLTSTVLYKLRCIEGRPPQGSTYWLNIHLPINLFTQSSSRDIQVSANTENPLAIVMGENVPTSDYIIEFLSREFDVSRDTAETALQLKPKAEVLGQHLRVFKNIVNHTAIIAELPGGKTALRLALTDHKKTLEQTKDLDRQLTALPFNVHDVLTTSVKAEIQRLRLEAEALDLEMRSKMRGLGMQIGTEA
ncbi:hypothetical protein BGX38DRAFT_174494 [Terfezia claveryi]|nr:hypothetical protein BGX38DRAFT_174494 [Terfezia claveryi]